MTSKSGLYALMQRAFRLYEESEAVLKEGLGITPDEAFASVNAFLRRVLEDEANFNKLSFSWHENPRKQGWDNEVHGTVVVSLEGKFQIPIPVKHIKDWGLETKVRKIMGYARVVTYRPQSSTWVGTVSKLFVGDVEICQVRSLPTWVEDLGVEVSEFWATPVSGGYSRDLRGSVLVTKIHHDLTKGQFKEVFPLLAAYESTEEMEAFEAGFGSKGFYDSVEKALYPCNGRYASGLARVAFEAGFKVEAPRKRHRSKASGLFLGKDVLDQLRRGEVGEEGEE